MDLILRNARVIGAEQEHDRHRHRQGQHRRHPAATSRPKARPSTSAGRLVTPGFIETHIHLDKSRILGRCKAEKGDLEEAIGEVAQARRSVHAGGRLRPRQGTLEKSILNGTTHMRTQLEVDPGIGLRGLEGVRPLIEEYKWAIDIEICIFPQEGLLNNPGTDELMVEALQERRQRGRRRALYRLKPARPDRPHLRDRARVRHRHRHASRLRARSRTISTCCTSASRPRSSNRADASRSATSPSCPARRRSCSTSAPSAWRTPASRSPCCPRPTSI